MIDIGDALLAVETCGEGRPVVLVSGVQGCASFWREQISVLATRHRVITFDQRGTGRSTHSSIRYGVRQMADDVLSVLDALDVERACLVGHGLGSATVLELAAGSRERVDRLVLGAPWAEPGEFLDRLVRLRETLLQQCGPRSYALADVLGGLPASWLHARPWRIEELVQVRLRDLKDPAVEASRLRAALEFNLRARLPSIRVPALVVTAADDQVVPHAMACEVARALPDARIAALESGGHYCALACADRYNALVSEFLDS